ncbi:MAG TPA: hypothetical protein PK263_03550, partial [bacterium]|nr:hypothetical protein [bacterium]
ATSISDNGEVLVIAINGDRPVYCFLSLRTLEASYYDEKRVVSEAIRKKVITKASDGDRLNGSDSQHTLQEQNQFCNNLGCKYQTDNRGNVYLCQSESNSSSDWTLTPSNASFLIREAASGDTKKLFSLSDFNLSQKNGSDVDYTVSPDGKILFELMEQDYSNSYYLFDQAKITKLKAGYFELKSTVWLQAPL